MKQIPGSQIAKQILAQVSAQVAAMNQPPLLAIISAGDDPASRQYIKLKQQKALEIGVQTRVIEFGDTCNFDEVAQRISDLNQDPAITAIMLQMPLFPHLLSHAWELASMIDPRKDVDGLTAINQGLLSQGSPQAIVPATVAAVLECLKFVAAEGEINLEANGKLTEFIKGKNVVIINHSNLIGKPLADALLNLNATVSVLHEFTVDLKNFTSQADIVVTATGQPGLITPDMIRDGAVVVDCTSMLDSQGKARGDVLQTSDLDHKSGWITPVPGGVGPLTIACLLRNCL